MIADFLVHLREDKSLSVPAIKGYRAALNQVFKLKGLDLGSSQELSLLIRGFERSCPPREVRPPEWDIVLVLKSLTRAPYEPLSRSSDMALTHKTVFLLALASAKRVSELHGISYRIRHTEGWDSVSFSFVTEFVAKTQNPSVCDSRFEGFSVPALPREGTDREERSLCPVRAVREYANRTKALRPACRHLFVSCGPNKKEVSKNTLSYWIRQVIRLAYYSAPNTPAPSRVRVHDMRKIGPSLAFRKNHAVGQVLRAGVWTSQNTFTKHTCLKMPTGPQGRSPWDL